jgi:spore maturation protein CgeB
MPSTVRHIAISPTRADIHVYPPTEAGALKALRAAYRADVIVKGSGVGVLDPFLENTVLELRRTGHIVAFWDVDAPATLERLAADPADAFGALIPLYDMIFTYGGGAPVTEAYERAGAAVCIPIYNALDAETHHPVPQNPRFAADASFLGNRLPDREERVDAFFFAATRALPDHRFLLGGSGWDQDTVPANVRTLGHVPTRDHNAFNCSATCVLNISRDSMARFGFSPATRVFEAAGAGACIITHAWRGVERFLAPGREILVVSNGDEAAACISTLRTERATQIGAAARRRVLADHTYAARAAELEKYLQAKLEVTGTGAVAV